MSEVVRVLADQALVASLPEPVPVSAHSGDGPSRVGPRVDLYHMRELPGHAWISCHECPSLRVNDGHYFYCRHLGDHALKDVWFPTGGWRWIGNTVWNETRPAPCGLATVSDSDGNPKGGDGTAPSQSDDSAGAQHIAHQPSVGSETATDAAKREGEA